MKLKASKKMSILFNKIVLENYHGFKTMYVDVYSSGFLCDLALPVYSFQGMTKERVIFDANEHAGMKMGMEDFNTACSRVRRALHNRIAPCVGLRDHLFQLHYSQQYCYMSVCRLVCLLAHDIDLYECILYLCVTDVLYVTDMNIYCYYLVYTSVIHPRCYSWEFIPMPNIGIIRTNAKC